MQKNAFKTESWKLVEKCPKFSNALGPKKSSQMLWQLLGRKKAKDHRWSCSAALGAAKKKHGVSNPPGPSCFNNRRTCLRVGRWMIHFNLGKSWTVISMAFLWLRPLDDWQHKNERHNGGGPCTQSPRGSCSAPVLTYFPSFRGSSAGCRHLRGFAERNPQHSRFQLSRLETLQSFEVLRGVSPRFPKKPWHHETHH